MIMKSMLLVAAVVIGSGMADEALAQVITADGSSTVYPITAEAARRNGVRVDNSFSGTTGGFRRFCAGKTDISNASRPINAEEIASCAQAGVDYVELPIAFDAIAVVAGVQISPRAAVDEHENRRVRAAGAVDVEALDHAFAVGGALRGAQAFARPVAQLGESPVHLFGVRLVGVLLVGGVELGLVVVEENRRPFLVRGRARRRAAPGAG